MENPTIPNNRYRFEFDKISENELQITYFTHPDTTEDWHCVTIETTDKEEWQISVDNAEEGKYDIDSTIYDNKYEAVGAAIQFMVEKHDGNVKE